MIKIKRDPLSITISLIYNLNLLEENKEYNINEIKGLTDLKNEYGKKIVFWGGGINPQKTLPFGTPDEVSRETKENVRILSQGGGYICAAVHNIQGPTPVENIITFFRSINS